MTSAGEDTNGSASGAAYLMAGPVSSGNVASYFLKVAGASGGDKVLSAAAADFDGDGSSEFLVGATDVSGSASTSGAAYLFYGVMSGQVDTSTADYTMFGVDQNDGAGSRVRFSGDMDGSGLPSIMIGAPNADANGADAGALYIIPDALTD